jgi:hypothetical protein
MRLGRALLAFVSIFISANLFAQTQPEVFDVNVYEGIYPDLFNVYGSNTNGAQNHWVNQGLPQQGRRASFIFDPVYYIAHNPGVPTGYTAALLEFINNGLPAGKRGSLEFDVKYYLARYSDLAAHFGTDYVAAADHFRNQGLPCEGRQGSADFAVQDYVNMYPDVAAGYPKALDCVNGVTDFKNAAMHWLRRGKGLGRHGFGFLNASTECTNGQGIVEFLTVQASPPAPWIPTQGTATVSQAPAFISNVSVFYINPPSGFAAQLTGVASNPARGQFSVSGGIYKFNAADIEQPVKITYNLNPVPAGYSRIFFSHNGGTGTGTLSDPFDASLMDDHLRRISEQAGQIPHDSNPGEPASGGAYHADHLIVCLIDTQQASQPFLTRGIWDFVMYVGHTRGDPDLHPGSPVPSGFSVNRSWHIHGQGMNVTTIKLAYALLANSTTGQGMVFGTHDDNVGGVEISDLGIDLNYPALKAANPSANLQLTGANLRGDPGGNNIHNMNVNGYAAQTGIEAFPVWIYSVNNVTPTQGDYDQIKYVVLGNSAPGAVCTGITLADVQGEVAYNVANGWSPYVNNFGGCQGYGGWNLDNAWFHDNTAFNNSTSFLVDSLANRSVTIEFNQFINPTGWGIVLGGGGTYDFFTIRYNTFLLANNHNVGIQLQGNVQNANINHNNILVSGPPPNVIAILFKASTTGNLGNILQFNQVGEGISEVPDGNCVYTNWDAFGNPLAFPPATQSTPCTAPMPASATPFTSYSLGSANEQVVFLGANQHVHQFVWNGTVLVDQDLTAMAGAPAAAPETGLTSYSFSTADAQIVYVGTNQHVYQLAWLGPGLGWINQDLTAMAGSSTPLASPKSAFTSFSLSHGTEQVVYQGADQHVYQLVWTGSAWINQDLTTMAGSSISVAPGSGLTNYSLSTTDLQVVYLGADQHVYQFAWNGSVWLNQDLTVMAGSNIPLANSGSNFTRFSLSRGTEQVVYQGADQHVYQLVWTGSAWINQDLTAMTGSSTFVAPGSGLTSYSLSTSGVQVVYLGSDQHVYQFAWNGSVWLNQDLTVMAGSNITLATPNSTFMLFSLVSGTDQVVYQGANQHVYQLVWTGSWINQDLTAMGGNP